jgi:hypothetical protein
MAQLSTFQMLQFWGDLVELGRSPSVLIAAAIVFPGSQSTSLDLYTKWCIDHGFELVEARFACALSHRASHLTLAQVEANSQSAAPSAGGETRGPSRLLDDDEVGFARILSALHSNMWPGLRRKGGHAAPSAVEALSAALGGARLSASLAQSEQNPGVGASDEDSGSDEDLENAPQEPSSDAQADDEENEDVARVSNTQAAYARFSDSDDDADDLSANAATAIADSVRTGAVGV